MIFHVSEVPTVRAYQAFVDAIPCCHEGSSSAGLKPLAALWAAIMALAVQNGIQNETNDGYGDGSTDRDEAK